MLESFRSRLDEGRTMIGLCTMYPSPGMIERVGGDWDFVWIDAQHGEMEYPDVLQIVRACELVNTASLVRVAWLEAGAVAKALDTAADGVIIPCIDSAEEARAAVAVAKFPPLGRRSYGGRRVIDRHGRTYSDNANKSQLLIVQIESPQALEQIDAIAAVPGVDGLMIGPDDIMLRRGMTMTTPRSEKTLGDDMNTIASACIRHGKFALGIGMGQEMFNLNLKHRFQMIVAGGDVPILANTSKQLSDEARQLMAAHASDVSKK